MVMPTAPVALYHYTNSAGLRGILESSSLWATDAEFLNDAQELQFGRNELCDALRAYAEDLFPSNRTPDGGKEYSRATIVRSALQYLDRGDVNVPVKTERIYVTCFCQDSDLLSQWRGYASADGYAIGFRSAALLDQVPLATEYRVVGQYGFEAERRAGPEVRPSLVQVQYGDLAVTRMIENVLQKIAPQPMGHPGSQGWMQAVSLAVPALASIKHSAFAEEKEWRLYVGGMGAGLKESFRVGSYGIIPYVELPLDLHNAIHEVVVGPGKYSDVRMTGVARLLRSRDLDSVNVRASSAPFRG